MAGASDIRAGKAFVELSLKDSLTKGLRAAGQKLQDFGKGMAVVGAAVGAAGAAITGPLMAALGHFSEFGSVLNDMSVRTGISAGSLAELGYAADLSGSSLEGVEKSVMKMQKAVQAAVDGNQEMRNTFRELGVDLEALKKLSPEDQFELLGQKISGISDPTKKAATAMKVFGKSGTQLLPMLEDLQALRKEAKDLGIVPDDGAVKLADELGDSFDRVKKSIGAVIFQIGGALAGAAVGTANVIARVTGAVANWIKNNQSLVTTIVGVGGTLVGIGGAIAVVAGGIAGIGAVLSGLATGIGAIGAVLGFVLSPVVLIAGAITAGVAAWALYTESGQSAVGSLVSAFGVLADIFGQTFGGIKDALSSGELMLAGQIAMAGLNVAFQAGLNAVNEATGGAVDWLRNAWESALSAVSIAVNNWRLLLQIAVTSAAVSVVSFGGIVSHLFTEVIPGYLTWFGEHWSEVFTDILNFTSTVATNIFTNLSNLWSGIVDLFSGNGFTFEWTPLTKGFESAIKELPKIAEREMGPLEQQMRSKLDALGNELSRAIEKDQAGRAPVTTQRKALSGAQEELDALTKRADQAAEAKREADANKKADLGETPDLASKGKEVFSTFSAAGLAAAGAGGGGGDTAADETRRLRDEAKQLAKEQADRDLLLRQAITSSFRVA